MSDGKTSSNSFLAANVNMMSDSGPQGMRTPPSPAKPEQRTQRAGTPAWRCERQLSKARINKQREP